MIATKKAPAKKTIKPKPKLKFYDERMMMVMEYVRANKVNGIKTKGGFWESIGYSQTNISNIISGMQSFRPQHFMTACQVYGIDARFFFVPSHLKMLAEDPHISAINRLKQAVAMVEMEMKGK